MTPEERRKADWQRRRRQADWQRRQAQQPQTAQPAPPTFLENVRGAAESGYRKYLEPTISSLAEVTEGMKSGDFGPLWQMTKEAARGTYHALTIPDPQVQRDPQTGRAVGTTLRPPDPVLQAAQAERQARYLASPEGRRSAERLAEIEARAALDPSLGGKITRGTVEALTGAAPALLAAVATRGAVLPTAFAAGLQSASNPSQIGPQAAVGMLPLPIGQAVRAGARRLFGRGVEEAAEAAATLPSRATVTRPPMLSAMDPAELQASFRGGLSSRAPLTVGPSATPNAALDAAVETAAARSPWQDTVLAYYRANLLTNPAGRALDLGSTVINQFADAAARPIAAAVDAVVSKLTGRRAITGLSRTGTGRAFGSLRQGARDVGDVLRTGRQAIDSGADDVLYGAEIKSGIGRGFDVPVNGVFRILGALDAPFRRFGFARNLFDRAKVAALNEVKQDLIPRGQLSARIRELLDDGDIIRAAIRDGEAAVLSQPNKISSWLASQTYASPNARLAIGIVQPFMRIPLNAVLKAADFAGIGGVKALYKIARGVGRKTRAQSFFRDLEDQRVFSQNVAAGSFGVAGFLLGIELEERGKMDGYYYTSKRDFPGDRVPTSVNIGGTRYDINRLGGFIAAPLFMGATYSRLRKQNTGAANALLRSFSGLAQQTPALSFYGAPAKAARILSAEEPGSEIMSEAGNITSGFLPASGALGATARALDPVKRREVEGFTGAVMNRIPGLRQRLPEKQQRKRKGR